MKLNKVMKWVIVLYLGICLILAFNFGMIKGEYEEYDAKLTDLVISINSQSTVINILQNTELEYEQDLYTQMYGYYDSLMETVNKSMEQEVFCKIFIVLYPTKDELINEREDSFVTLYALIQKYPDILEYGDTSEILENMKTTTMELQEAVTVYNEYVDQYNDIGEKINNCKYVKHFGDIYISEIPQASIS